MVEAVRTVALLFGGVSPEHEVSIASAGQVAGAIDALDDARAVPVYITREGKWRWGRTSLEMTSAELVLAVLDEAKLKRHYEPVGLDFPQALLNLNLDEYFTICIMLHGSNGEDGRLQGALEFAGLRFTGSGSAASALALDKARCQVYLAALGLPVPKFIALDASDATGDDVESRIAEEIGFPCVVKPSLGGSSVGISIVNAREGVGDAIRIASGVGSVILAEEFIEGREFTCGVLERDGIAPLPVTEIIPPEGRFFDYQAKYTPGVSNEVTPAEIDAELSARIQELAVETHRAIGCSGFSRTDFMMGDAGLKIIEINTIPGMTATSLLPQGAAAAGIDFPQLIDAIIGRGGD